MKSTTCLVLCLICASALVLLLRPPQDIADAADRRQSTHGTPDRAAQPCGVYTGSVFDERGEPCVGHSVIIARRTAVGLVALPPVLTDAGGRFTVDEADVSVNPNARVEIRDTEGNLFLQSPITRCEDCVLEVRRHPVRLRGRLRGVVPQQELRVRILIEFCTATDSEREIVVTPAPDGVFSADTRIPLHLARDAVVARVIGETLHCQRCVRLQDLMNGSAVIDLPTSLVTVQVIKAGKPVPAVRLAVALDTPDGLRAYHTLRNLGADGACHLVTDRGRLVVWAIVANEAVTSSTVDVRDEPTSLTVELGSPSYRVSGRVVDPQGRPRAGTMVFCLPVTEHAGVFNTFLTEPCTTDKGGNFEIPFAGAERTCQFFAQSAVASSPIAQVRGPATFDIVFDDLQCELSARISGLGSQPLLWDHSTLVAVAGGRVFAKAIWGSLSALSVNIPADRIERLYLAGPGFRTVALGDHRVVERSSCDVEFALVPPLTAQLIVQDGAGHGLGNARVSAVWDVAPTLPWETCPTTVDGRCEVRVEPFGRRLIGFEVSQGGNSKLVAADASVVSGNAAAVTLVF